VVVAPVVKVVVAVLVPVVIEHLCLRVLVVEAVLVRLLLML
jgi:hypothetical protein